MVTQESLFIILAQLPIQKAYSLLAHYQAFRLASVCYMGVRDPS